MAKRKTAEMENEMAKRKTAEMENERAEQKEVVLLGKEVTYLISEMRSIPDGAKVKDAFLWELLRNADSAIALARRETLVDEKIHCPESELFIHIVPDKKNGSLTIIDSGAGMTKRELAMFLGYKECAHLGTIWKYATTRSDVDLSPLYLDHRKFSLGFNSAYMVADRVVVTTKATNGDQYVWESDGFDSCTIARDTYGERLGRRGTKVTLFLNDNHLKYAEERILTDLIKKYVGRLTYPIHILVDDDDEKTMKEIVVDDEKRKEEPLPIETLRIKFEGLRKKFEKFIGHRVDKVVVSDRLFDLPKNLSTDRKTFEINPRSPVMEALRRKADRKDFDEDEMECLIEKEFQDCILNIRIYDWRYGTSFYETLSLDQRVCRYALNLGLLVELDEKMRKRKRDKKKRKKKIEMK